MLICLCKVCLATHVNLDKPLYYFVILMIKLNLVVPVILYNIDIVSKMIITMFNFNWNIMVSRYRCKRVKYDRFTISSIRHNRALNLLESAIFW